MFFTGCLCVNYRLSLFLGRRYSTLRLLGDHLFEYLHQQRHHDVKALRIMRQSVIQYHVPFFSCFFYFARCGYRQWRTYGYPVPLPVAEDAHESESCRLIATRDLLSPFAIDHFRLSSRGLPTCLAMNR